MANAGQVDVPSSAVTVVRGTDRDTSAGSGDARERSATASQRLHRFTVYRSHHHTLFHGSNIF